MLFDLRGSGRRRTVKVVYVTLAFLLGGGLVLFGIGGDVSGGLIDAITERGGGGDAGTDRLRDRERQLAGRVARNRQDATAYAELARVRVQLSQQGENYDVERNAYTEEGRAKLREADAAWKRHLELAGDKADDGVAAVMVRAYTAQNRLADAVRAQEIVAAARDAPGPYSQLAVLAYQAGQTRKGDLAADRAVELSDPDMRTSLRGQLDAAKQQATGSPATSPTPTADAG